MLLIHYSQPLIRGSFFSSKEHRPFQSTDDLMFRMVFLLARHVVVLQNNESASRALS